MESAADAPLKESAAGVEPGLATKEAEPRTLRVAVASADGKFVHQHFGRATHFQIFELTGTLLRFVETRLATPACGGPDGHNQAQLERMTDLVSDCDVVLVAQIGAGAEAQLAQRGVRVFAVQDFIPDALQALQRAWGRIQLRDPLVSLR
jgi:predicted Fe-Mo cluster-binding NifX family protein